MNGTISRGTGIASPEGFFDGRLVYKQPRGGFRSSVDSLALMCFVHGNPGRSPERVCDLGCGSGFLALVAALLWPEAEIVGVELSSLRARFARANAKANKMEGRLEILEEDIRDLDLRDFDLILSNPPYHPVSSGTLPRDPDNARARFEVDLDLTALLKSAARSLSKKGTLCLVYPEKRWSELVETARLCGLGLARWCPVHTNEMSPPFLVVAAFHNNSDPGEDVMPESAPPMVLETAEKGLGEALAEFVSEIANTCPTDPVLSKKPSS